MQIGLILNFYQTKKISHFNDAWRGPFVKGQEMASYTFLTDLEGGI